MRLNFAVLLSLLLAVTSDARECNRIQLGAGVLPGKRPVCNCEGWRLMVEVNNVRNWTVVPEECVKYVRDYMTEPDRTNQTQYESDMQVLSRQILQYLQELPPPSVGDTWVFDLMNTLISDLDYYSVAANEFGGVPFNKQLYDAWITNPASIMKRVVYMDEVYYAARLKGYNLIIISGNNNEYENALDAKLKEAGFVGWTQFILNNNPSISSGEFKKAARADLLSKGYRVIGNVGDQWSDLLGGDNAGSRVFKLPNPMYYVKY